MPVPSSWQSCAFGTHHAPSRDSREVPDQNLSVIDCDFPRAASKSVPVGWEDLAAMLHHEHVITREHILRIQGGILEALSSENTHRRATGDRVSRSLKSRSPSPGQEWQKSERQGGEYKSQGDFRSPRDVLPRENAGDRSPAESLHGSLFEQDLSIPLQASSRGHNEGAAAYVSLGADDVEREEAAAAAAELVLDGDKLAASAMNTNGHSPSHHKSSMMKILTPGAMSVRDLEEQSRHKMKSALEALTGAKGWIDALTHDTEEEKAAWSHEVKCCKWLTPARFQNASCVLILIYSIYIGIETETTVRIAKEGEGQPDWFWICDAMFAIAFTVEISLRFALERSAFFQGREYKWNLVDLFLVATQLLDLIVKFWNFGFLRVMRVIRVLRAGRVLRTMRYFTELRVMVMSIVSSMTSLMWAFLLLLVVLYLAAVCILQVVSYEIESKDMTTNELHHKLFEYYGSLGACLLTLFKSISGGADWQDLVEPLTDFHKGYVLIYVLYVSFMVFGVMNVLTAIFVESASQIAQVDQDLAIQEQLRRDKSSINTIKAMFNQADQDRSGELSQEELEHLLQDPKCVWALRLIDIEVAEARGLFQLLDMEEKNAVGIDEFVTGMMRLKGGAKGVDVATIIYENKKMFHHLSNTLAHIASNLASLEQATNSMRAKAFMKPVTLRSKGELS
mmetsp:Transcript_25378/g.59022  ORF Transcript_25378/g.59022 Transcript_25378/m.59022 type:complete len:679 (+) Transcript_25378:108-2144(+)